MGIEEFMIDRAEKEGIEKGFKKGIKKGQMQNAGKFVTYLLTNTDFDIPQIAKTAEVSEKFVDSIKKRVELDGSLN